MREIGRGALGVVFEELEKDLAALKSENLKEYADKVRTGIKQIQEASAALLKGMNYALLNARLMGEAVIDVIAATELLRQADHDPKRFDLAAYWSNRKMLEVDAHTRRISSGDEARIERCEKLIELFE
jgi:hypothetical protein